MRKNILILSGTIFLNGLFAQNAQNASDVYYTKCIHFEVSKPLRDLAKEFPVSDEERGKTEVPRRKKTLPLQINPNALPLGDDPIAQKRNGTRSLSAPLVNWQGQNGDSYPPDPTGAAGPNHYVQAVNDSYTAYDKSGNSLMQEFALSHLWPGSTDEGDPIVMYDKFADRWFISQFQANSSILIAISTSPDPTGTFYLYTFLPNSNDFPDYPKFCIWNDGYYMTANWGTQRITVFDRTKMLAGNSNAGMIVKNSPNIPTGDFFCPLGSDADGQLPPNGTPCYFFAYEDDSWGTTDQINIIKMNTDWTTPGNSTISLDQSLPTQAFNSVFSGTWDDIPQAGTSQKLDALNAVFMYRAQYRRWTEYNTVTLCNSVNLGTGSNYRAAIRWYELRQNSTSGVWSIYQQGTYAPDNKSRWMGSITMDDNGSIGIAYAISDNTSIHPSICYTGRLASDPLGQFTFAEQTAIAGTASQTDENRYGDYSQTVLDPDGLTFWHTGEYLTNNSNNGKIATRIFSFKITDPATGIKDIENTQQFTVFQSDNNLKIKGIKLASNADLSIDLFDISGKLISSKKVTPFVNTFETTIDFTNLAKTTYLVRIGNSNFQKVIKVLVN